MPNENFDSKTILELNTSADRDARYERAVELLGNLVRENRPLEKVIRILNRMGSVDDEGYKDSPEKKGKYRSDTGIVYGGEGGRKSFGIRSEYLPEMMGEFGKCLESLLDNKTIDSNEIAGFANLMLGVIHPFIEGNGRTSRLLMNYVLVKRGLKPKNLDDELIDIHLNTGKKSMDVEIDPNRSFGKTIVKFTELLDKKVEDSITKSLFREYEETGHYSMYPPSVLEVKPEVIKSYFKDALVGRLSEIPKIKEMAEIIKELPDYSADSKLSALINSD
jgi:hypothetical protein